MNCYIYFGVDIDHVIVIAKKQIKSGQVILYYDDLRMEQAIAVKEKAMSGNKVILINGNDIEYRACEALLKSIEESKARIIIATTKELPATILSRGILLEVTEAMDSKVRRLVFAGVNFVEANELISVFGSVSLARGMFNDFVECVDDFVTLFRGLEARDIKEIQIATINWDSGHFRLLGVIAEFLNSANISFGVRKYFFESLKISVLNDQVLNNIMRAVQVRNKNLARYAVAMSVY